MRKLHRHSPRNIGRNAGAIAVLVCLLAPAHAQAPGSVFGQQPQPLSPRFQPPPASSVAPSKKPAATTPDWNASRPNAAPALTPPAAGPAPRTAVPLKTDVPARNARAPQLSKEKLTKWVPKRAGLLQVQVKIRDEQNRIAQGLRGHAGGQPLIDNAARGAFAQAPGRTSSLAAAAEAHSPLAVRNARTQDALARQPDGISFINGKPRDFIITPGGSVIIAGKGFGPASGRAFASGLTGFPGGAAALRVIAWSNFEIDAVLPAGIRGVPDIDGISAQVFTPAGKSFTLANGKFIAAREEITLTSQLDRLILLKPSAAWPWIMAADGGVHRWLGGNSVECPSAGTDELIFQPPSGFEVSGVVMRYGRTDTGDGDAYGHAGNHLFIPGYGIGDWDTTAGPGGQLFDRLSIAWGIFRSHTSPGIFKGVANGDQCNSDYQIAVSLVGPAGVAPF